MASDQIMTKIFKNSDPLITHVDVHSFWSRAWNLYATLAFRAMWYPTRTEVRDREMALRNIYGRNRKISAGLADGRALPQTLRPDVPECLREF